MGANAPIPEMADVRITSPEGAEVNVTALQVYADGKIRGDGDLCFSGQPATSDGAVSLSRPARNQASFAMRLGGLPAAVEKIVLTAAVEAPRGFGQSPGQIALNLGEVSMAVPTAGRQERALILAELYRRNGQWKIRNVSQGFNGGLEALAAHFGVQTAETLRRPPAPPPPPPAPPRPAVNLSKISLTKAESKVSLKKTDGKFGKIKVNLNWSQTKRKKLFGSSSGIDLDLGALVEAANGDKTAVQALGDSFGDYGGFPFVRLLADDRTGASTDGEWLEINGDLWPQVRRILIYAFIYDGAPNWAETDGVVRVMAPGQPEIEVRMNEHGSPHSMCAVALIENVGGEIRISREVAFHPGHQPMDRAYGWGMTWTRGRK